MNIAVDVLGNGAVKVERLLIHASSAVAAAIDAIAMLQSKGLEAAADAGVSVGLIGSVMDYAGRANADVSHAALMLQGVHASLHEALKRLQPSDPTPQVSGGKVPPPPP